MEYIPFRNTYWNYYTQIERDFFSYAPYCEIDEQSTNAFSTRYLQLLLSICGEIDSIFKTFCKVLKPDLDTNTCGMTEYIDNITDKWLDTKSFFEYIKPSTCPNDSNKNNSKEEGTI